MKFNINKYEGKYVMHCNTEKEAEIFCFYLDSVGRRWCYCYSYLRKNKWFDYKEFTAYAFNEGTLDNVLLFEDEGYKVLEFSDFEWDEYNVEETLKNIQTKATLEYEAFKKSLIKKSTEELLSHSYELCYEICIKNEFYSLLANIHEGNIHEDSIKPILRLNGIEKPLEYLYQMALADMFCSVSNIRWNNYLDWIDNLKTNKNVKEKTK